MSVNFTLPPTPKNDETNRPDLFAAALFFMLAVVGKVFLGDITSAVQWLFGLQDSMSRLALSSIIYYFGFMLLPLLLYIRKYPSAADGMRISPLSGRSAFLCSLAAVLNLFVMLFISIFWSVLIECFGGGAAEESMFIPDTSGGLLLMIIFSAIIPGICEELLLRGALLNAWEERGTPKAIMVTSALFMLLHSDINGMPTELLSGIILAVIVVSTDSVLAGIIFHTVYNSINIIIVYALENGATGAVSELSLLESIGGLSGLFSLSIPAAGLSFLLILILKLLDRERIRKKRFAFGYPPSCGRDLSLAEYLILCSGIAITLILYVPDYLSIVGWL